MKHKCPVNGCPAKVAHTMLMCAGHWHLVPTTLQRAVWREYRKAPQSDAHTDACNAATLAVNELLAKRADDAQ